MPPIINKNKCIKCGTCADICNNNIFVFDPEKKDFPEIRFPDECWHCNSCVLDCPAKAITLRIPLAYMLLHTEAENLHPKGDKA